MSAPAKYGTLLQGANGGLRIWKHPEPGRLYVIGSDTSAGVRDGDYSAAEVLDAETSEQVAEYHGLYQPTYWGYRCARLANYYNDAWLAFETQPSPHGLTAYEAAANYGCTSLWVQRRYDALEGKYITRKGWVRSQGTTMHLIHRGRDALVEGTVIRSEKLLEEMQALRLEDGKPKSSLHDDLLIAYCIALFVRDDAWHKGAVTVDRRAPADEADAYWQRQDELDTPAASLPDDRYDWSAL